MKKVLGYIAIALLAVPFTFAAVKVADSQWEYKTRNELEYRISLGYEEVTPEYLSTIKKCMPEGFKFEDWGHPELDCDGHCDFGAMELEGVDEVAEIEKLMRI